MSKKKKIILAVVVLDLVIFGGLFIFLSYSGLLASVEFSQKEYGGFYLAYTDFVGPYQNVQAPMDQVYESLKAQGENPKLGFGLYFDNPEEVDADKLRSQVGCIFQDKIPAPEDTAAYTIRNYERGAHIYAEFPYKNSVSIMLGVFIVYPKLKTYVKEHGLAQGPVMEIYDRENEKIIYIMQAKQE